MTTIQITFNKVISCAEFLQLLGKGFHGKILIRGAVASEGNVAEIYAKASPPDLPEMTNTGYGLSLL